MKKGYEKNNMGINTFSQSVLYSPGQKARSVYGPITHKEAP